MCVCVIEREGRERDRGGGGGGEDIRADLAKYLFTFDEHLSANIP